MPSLLIAVVLVVLMVAGSGVGGFLIGRYGADGKCQEALNVSLAIQNENNRIQAEKDLAIAVRTTREAQDIENRVEHIPAPTDCDLPLVCLQFLDASVSEARGDTQGATDPDTAPKDTR